MFGISQKNAKIEELELQLIQKESILSAINKHVAYIEFTPEGIILDAKLKRIQPVLASFKSRKV